MHLLSCVRACVATPAKPHPLSLWLASMHPLPRLRAFVAGEYAPVFALGEYAPAFVAGEYAPVAVVPAHLLLCLCG